VEAAPLELPTGGHGLQPMPLEFAVAPLWEQ
jgi:hypothetical protein